jgi:SWI/SNF related-matrix-associated actin-dependent regulator of chromatin subfamily C
VQSGHLKWPKVFLNKVPVGKLNLLSKIVRDHGGALVTTEEAATHVVDWNEEIDAAPEAGDDFIRILEVRGPREASRVRGGGTVPAAGGAALVHWWYYPDSYNEWIPDTEISAGDAPDLASATAATRDKWYVCCRFVLDCERFNEWGNPSDYENESLEVEDAAMEHLSAAAGADLQQPMLGTGGDSPRASTKKSRGKKRFSQLAAGAHEKEKGAPAKDVPVLGALAGTEKLQPDAIPPSLRPEGPAQIVEMAPAGGESKLVAVGAAEVGSKRSASEAQLEGSSAVAECVLPAGVTEPAWFQQGAVSEFEEQVLGAACTADAADYLKVRNGVINLCAQSPLQYITATECRRKLPGDVSRILQVHEFLNAFALINGRARREARPDLPTPLLTASYGALTSGRAQRQPAQSEDGSWAAKEDALLQKLVAKQAGSGAEAASVDWRAVAEGLSGSRSAADCAARFVALRMSPAASARAEERPEDLAALVRAVTRVRSPCDER